MRILVAAVVCFVFAVSGQSAEPTSTAALSRDDHLRLAAEHLRALGMNDDAERIARPGQGMNQTPLQRLAEARAELERTLDEIRRLEEETGFSQGIELRIRCVEVATADLESLQLKNTPGGESLVMEAARAAELIGQIDQMQKAGKAIAKADTSLLTRNGRPATMVAGGESPVLIPGEGGKLTLQYVHFGNRIEALPAILEARRARIDISFENSERDLQYSAEVGGNIVPGVRRCQLNTQFEAKFGQTVMWLINVPSPESRCWRCVETECQSSV